MALKISPNRSKRVKFRKDLKDYTYLGCPLTRNRTPWCFRTCKPSADGTGLCGRIAPHSFKSRIQQGIEDFKKKNGGSSTPLRYYKPTFGQDI